MDRFMASLAFSEIFGKGKRAKDVFRYYNGDLEEIFKKVPPVIARDNFLNQKEKEKLLNFDVNSIISHINEVSQNGYEIVVDSIKEHNDNTILNYPIVYYRAKNGKDKLDNSGRVISVIGTKNPSKYAGMATKKLVEELVMTETTIVTQLVEGLNSYVIDIVLACGGKPIVVTPYGVRKSSNNFLNKQKERVLASGGEIISPFFNDLPHAGAVYSVVSELCTNISDAVLITQAPEGSGALKIAEFAMRNAKNVFVIPGTILGEGFKGSNRLINNGGILAEDGVFIAETLGAEITLKESAQIKRLSSQTSIEGIGYSESSKSGSNIVNIAKTKPKLPAEFDNDKIYKDIFEILLETPLTIELLCEHIKDDVGKTMASVTMLEISDVIELNSSRQYIIKNNKS